MYHNSGHNKQSIVFVATCEQNKITLDTRLLSSVCIFSEKNKRLFRHIVSLKWTDLLATALNDACIDYMKLNKLSRKDTVCLITVVIRHGLFFQIQ